MVVLLLSYITAFAKCVFHRIAADEFFNGDKICIFLEMKTGKKKKKITNRVWILLAMVSIVPQVLHFTTTGIIISATIMYNNNNNKY